MDTLSAIRNALHIIYSDKVEVIFGFHQLRLQIGTAILLCLGSNTIHKKPGTS